MRRDSVKLGKQLGYSSCSEIGPYDVVFTSSGEDFEYVLSVKDIKYLLGKRVMKSEKYGGIIGNEFYVAEVMWTFLKLGYRV